MRIFERDHMSTSCQFNGSAHTPAEFRNFNCSNHPDLIGHKSAIDKKLLVICHSYNNFQKDSIEGMSEYFRKVNVLVRTNPFAEISNYLPVPQLDLYKKSYKIDMLDNPLNIEVISTPLWYLPLDTSYKTLGEKHFNAVEKAIRHHHLTFDLIHTHFTWSAGCAGARLKEEYGVPLVVTAHGDDIYYLPFKDDEWREKIKYVLNTANHIITVSQSNLACIKKLDISTPITVIPNGFKSDLFYPRDSYECRKTLKLPLDKRIILTVGSLDPVKGQMNLVEAIQEIILKNKDILCVIVGFGEFQAVLKRQIHSLGLKEYVMLAGGKPHDEIPLWMNACDIFALPSLRESFGVVQLEALACGKPVVATRNGGSEEVITSEEYGLLVKPADPGDLAEKILMALDREWDREKIFAYAEQFTWESISKDILKIYRGVGVWSEHDLEKGIIH